MASWWALLLLDYITIYGYFFFSQTFSGGDWVDKYLYNVTFVRQYERGDGNGLKLKVTRMNAVRNAGLELDDDRAFSPPGSVNDVKLSESVARARSKIFELGYCNRWDWFFTGTLNRQLYDRTNLEKYHKDLTQWFRNYGRQHGIKIDFLLIPELHSDGKSWHMHGLLHGLPVSHLKQFVIGDVMGKALADKVKRGDEVYNWNSYAKKFGFCDLEPIRNHEAVCKYITKYCTEELGRCVSEVGAHLYYRSRGLKTSIRIKKGAISDKTAPLFDTGFATDYCEVFWRDFSCEEDISRFINSSFEE